MVYADWLLLGLVALSVLIGLWRGFIQEVFALAVWVLAFLLAFQYSGLLAELLVPWIELPSARTAAAFGGIFIVALVVGGLLSWLLHKLVASTGLSGTDRLMGGVFGAVRGVLLIVMLVLVAGFTPVPADPWWQESQVIRAVMPLADWAAGLLPESVREWLELHPQDQTPAAVQA